jgi:hypothetical protein
MTGSDCMVLTASEDVCLNAKMKLRVPVLKYLDTHLLMF